MADPKKIVPENTPGNLFVDLTCIDCDVCRKLAPSIFGEGPEHSFVKTQPRNEEEELDAGRALICCPVGSIGQKEKRSLTKAHDSFPLTINDDVYLLGYHSKKSFAAESYLARLGTHLVMIDSPRFYRPLAEKIQTLGKVDYILLTHRDDVSDYEQWRKALGAQVLIHADDSDVVKNPDIVIKGEEEVEITKDLKIIPTPGHTKGHLCFLLQDKYLFTGDHLYYSRTMGDFYATKDYCWYDWEKQRDSIEKLKVYQNVTWIFPGHGQYRAINPGELPQITKRVLKNYF